MSKLFQILVTLIMVMVPYKMVSAEVPKNVNGKLIVGYSLSHNAILPFIFDESDRLFVKIDGSGKDILIFYKKGELLQEVNVNEKTGDTDFETPFYMYNVVSGLDKINFDWKDDFGSQTFRSNSIEWFHRDGLIPTMLSVLLGHTLIYEVVLKKVK